jgi:hypothetical protein
MFTTIGVRFQKKRFVPEDSKKAAGMQDILGSCDSNFRFVLKKRDLELG